MYLLGRCDSKDQIHFPPFTLPEAHIIRQQLRDALRRQAHMVAEEADEVCDAGGGERWQQEDDLRGDCFELLVVASLLAEFGRTIDDEALERQSPGTLTGDAESEGPEGPDAA